MKKREHPRGIVIAVGNQKGGVGKTTNTVHLAAALGQGGYRCLIIDLDPAAGATRHLGVPENKFAGTFELLTQRESADQLIISENLPHGVHLITSRPQLSELDAALSKFADRTKLLEQPLAAIRKSYDFVFLDTAPFAGATTTVAAYSVARWILLSAFPHPLSLGGLTEAFRDVSDVRRHRNPALEVLGVVFSNVDGRATRLRAELESAAAAALPGRMFETHISQAVLLPELSGCGKTVFQVPAYLRVPVAQQYLRLAAEVEHRTQHRELFLQGKLPAVADGLLSVPRAFTPLDEFTLQDQGGK
ncbi:MAG: ParA family protein [Phycisphaerales bacterium]|nr:ParA family protein [Phycisphaerales bacterium]